jgi:hypothetical protein
MPTADSANSRPTNISSARMALLMALRRESRPPVAERSSRASIADDIQKREDQYRPCCQPALR